MNYKEQFDFWVNDDYFDENTKKELLAIRNDDQEVEDRFYKDLEFGTGGLRGVIGADRDAKKYANADANEHAKDFCINDEKIVDKRQIIIVYY